MDFEDHIVNKCQNHVGNGQIFNQETQADWRMPTRAEVQYILNNDVKGMRTRNAGVSFRTASGAGFNEFNLSPGTGGQSLNWYAKINHSGTDTTFQYGCGYHAAYVFPYFCVR